MVLVPVTGDKGLAAITDGGGMLFTDELHDATSSPDGEEHQLYQRGEQHMVDAPLEIHGSHIRSFCRSNIYKRMTLSCSPGCSTIWLWTVP